ncbi:MAG: undecaprenyl-diphosphate phosphatase [Solirubrobacteraceae bacterium]|nr:undecaprenyl-diphosphate phosphatase [Solirubrobacteraceae bacterium]
MALTVRRAVALGVAQGICELLPVSSSAHVGLLARDLPVSQRRTLEVALHGGSAAVLPWMLRGVARPSPVVIAAATAPPVLVGALAADAIERRASGPRAIVAGLVAGSAALVLADSMSPSRPISPSSRHRPADGVALGLAQAAALLPGVSRRGATLAAARARGFDRAGASDLSWAVGAPVMAAAAARGVIKADLRADAPALLAGAIAAGATMLALIPARPAIDRVPYRVWAAWRVALAAVAGTLKP